MLVYILAARSNYPVKHRFSSACRYWEFVSWDCGIRHHTNPGHPREEIECWEAWICLDRRPSERNRKLEAEILLVKSKLPCFENEGSEYSEVQLLPSLQTLFDRVARQELLYIFLFCVAFVLSTRD